MIKKYCDKKNWDLTQVVRKLKNSNMYKTQKLMSTFFKTKFWNQLQ